MGNKFLFNTINFSNKYDICNLVLDSIWYDPRVRKTLNSTSEEKLKVCALGIEDGKFDVDELNKLNIPTTILRTNYRTKKFIILALFSYFITILQIRKILINISPSVVHANDFSALIPAYLGKKKGNYKIVYDTHEIAFGNLRGPIINRFIKIIEKYLIRNTFAVVSVSNSAASYLSEVYQIPKPVVVTNAASIKNRKIQRNDSFSVLIHGQYYRGRGYNSFIEAADILKNLPIKFILRGYGELEQDLRTIVSEKQLSNVMFCQPVSVDKLVEYASLATIGIAITEPININFKYSISNKIFEYVTAGLPVIMSSIPEHIYLNELYDFGIVLPDNKARSLAEAIKKLYENSELLEKLRVNSQNLVDDLNWESEFKKILQIYKSILFHNKSNYNFKLEK